MNIAIDARGRAVLVVAHVAGMVDLVALPVWIGTLVQHYGFDYQRAGITVTAFLLGVVGASIALAPLFARLSHRATAIGGFATAAAAFLGAAATRDANLLLALHLTAGAGTGCALSMAHGTIGRSANPHRLFAIAGTALGIFAVVFYATVPGAVAAHGGAVLFQLIAVLMALAAIAALAFPRTGTQETRATAGGRRVPPAAWLALAGVMCLTLNQAIVFGFLERIGASRGFGQERINLVLAAVGIVNLFPAALAGLLQRRLPPLAVATTAPVLQALLALTICSSLLFLPFAIAGSAFAFVVIFAHTFLFGLIARLDPSGRAAAAMPAATMAGSAFGPALAGAVAQQIGFQGVGFTAVAIAAAGTVCFVLADRAMVPATR